MLTKQKENQIYRRYKNGISDSDIAIKLNIPLSVVTKTIKKFEDIKRR